MKTYLKLVVFSLWYPIRNIYWLFIPLLLTALALSLLDFYAERVLIRVFRVTVIPELYLAWAATILFPSILIASPYIGGILRNLIHGHRRFLSGFRQDLLLFIVLAKLTLTGIIAVILPVSIFSYLLFQAGFMQFIEGLVAVAAIITLGMLVFSQYIMSVSLQVDGRQCSLRDSKALTRPNVFYVATAFCLTLIVMRIVEAIIIFLSMKYFPNLSSLYGEIGKFAEYFSQNVLTVFILTIFLASLAKIYLKVGKGS